MAGKADAVQEFHLTMARRPTPPPPEPRPLRGAMADSELVLDPERAALDKAERHLHFRTRTVPRLRLMGFGLMVLLLPLHNAIFLGGPSWDSFGRLAAAGMGLALGAWWVLLRFPHLVWRGFTPDDLFLGLDMLMISFLVYATGAERSLLFPLYLSRVGDQTHTTFPRALFWTHFVTGAFLGVIAWSAWVDHHAVSWAQECTKALGLYVTGLYISLTTREAERLRNRLRKSIQLAREFGRRVTAQAEELKEAKQAAEEASRAKSAFLAATSHDLRTPLNAILLYSELLREDAEAAGQAETVEDLKKIHGAGQHLLQLLNDLLDLAKVEAGKMTLFVEDIHVPGFVEDLRNLAAPLVAQKGNRLSIDVDPALDALQSDATRLRQILLNLLGNAAKFTEAGDISLALRADPAADGPWFLAEVRDTGVGMTREQVERLFQEFSQAEETTTRKFGGTGLGLVLCRRLCDLMGGTIHVSSVPGAGSTFTVRLPWRRGSDPVERPQRLAPAAPLAGRKALIIDDDAAFREGLRRVLVQEGFEILEAPNGEEGLRLAREGRPSLITLDVVMPGLDGWTVLRTLKEDPDLGTIPVILLTMADDRSQGYALGASGYLTKPLDPKSFQDMVGRFAPGAGTVLLVEDDAAQREALARLLRDHRWQVLEAEHGREALATLEQGSHPDLILLDLQMPHMDGFEFMDRLRQRASWNAIPVVVLTAADLTEDARATLARHQVDQVLSKGAYPREQLLEVVRDLAKALPSDA